MSEEWGPWIDHDGLGCPCVGMFVHNIHEDGHEWFGIAGSQGGRSWNWRSKHVSHVIRYRIRKPKGLTILEGLLENLPEHETA